MPRLTAIIGMRGIGKSTVARALVNELRPSVIPVFEEYRPQDSKRLLAAAVGHEQMIVVSELGISNPATIAGIYVHLTGLGFKIDRVIVISDPFAERIEE